ncbi:DgyrCDS13626 [Dimorphilus gyrociliatus]|uniref:DgyrCDS13626 n=1 Tax=Dimorphilus gyrociliatus TaxID=2664684 RepID=A0A7I8WB64_9ANNE|nr:DgyrCDS13626 [Dimorphilus gyrociliatus]
MPWISGCCCFESLSKGSKASGVFTLVVGTVNICIGIILLYNMHWLEDNLEANEREIFLPPGCIPIVYLAQVFNVILIIVGLQLIIGVNRGLYGKNRIFLWIYFSIFHRSWELFLLVYTCVWFGSHRFTDIIFVIPEVHAVIAYWVICLVLLICAIICVASYWQEVDEESVGKFKRKKHFLKLSNIRQAGYHRHGASTPGSLYGIKTPRSTVGLSRSTILAGQAVSSHAGSAYNWPEGRK